MEDLSAASERFHSEVAAKSLELDLLREHQFVDDVGEVLVEAGEMGDCIRCSYKARGLKVDGYHFDYEFGVLNLVVAHWIGVDGSSIAKVPDSQLNAVFKRCTNFFRRSLAGLHERIEIANEAHDLATLIHEARGEINAVRMVLITDGLTRKRPAEVEELDGVEITRVIWDVERILQFIETGEIEPVTVDFVEDIGGVIPCLAKPAPDGSYTTYLAYIPGQYLADMYSRWGTRLLDMNVRVFLSARGKVNRGLRDTIANEPEMFCAYNNGITVFARDLVLEELGNGMLGISKAVDFQIVNGGQTVGSLYHASVKQKADLSGISVQTKIVVIGDKDSIATLVPRISEYSNTQNRVSIVDLAANDPPHPELHEISRRLPAPDPTGGSRQTYWFYERARGSYLETRRMEARTPAKQRAFDALYPRKQRFDKNIFGKAWNTYLRKPHIVSLGAQKNFANFNLWLREQEDDLEVFFKRTVALVFLWKEAERTVRRQSFKGYRHNIVTYSLAWIFETTDAKIDLDKIWRTQVIGEGITEAVEGVCHVVNEHIRDTELNVTEWCKKEECWGQLKEKSHSLPHNIADEFIGPEVESPQYDPRTKAEAEVVTFCRSKEAEAWFALSSWLRERGFLTPKARSQCYNMGRFLSRDREPSYVLAHACKKAWEAAEVRGWEGKR